MLHHVKGGFRTEPPRIVSTYSLISENRVLLVNLDRLPARARGRRISQQLRVAALLQAQKPEDAALDRLSAGQQAVVLQQRGLPRPERLGDRFALVGCQDDAPEGAVEGQVVVEGAGVLGRGVEELAERAEGAAVD